MVVAPIRSITTPVCMDSNKLVSLCFKHLWLKINYDIAKESFVRFTIFDILGREVLTLINQQQAAGYYSINWNVKDMFGVTAPADIYFYHLQTKEFSKTRKMILLK